MKITCNYINIQRDLNDKLFERIIIAQQGTIKINEVT